ncbi:hypothetical protein C2G38_2206536 [Gigaspora rosea]|uniref:Uncharacterized protein n=1 Tax=Gigaspora rosea TaxID=44941 RepID=A0A397UJ25_9GLOM|nr:hypothetical protein C2G38_2206536 [Gigaspora rosea]
MATITGKLRYRREKTGINAWTSGWTMVAPESFGVIRWEVSNGIPPFQKKNLLETRISVYIYRGKREIPIEGTPSPYTEPYKKKKKRQKNDPAREDCIRPG